MIGISKFRWRIERTCEKRSEPIWKIFSHRDKIIFVELLFCCFSKWEVEVTVYVVNFFMGVNRTNEKSCLSRRTRDFGICKGNFFCLDST